MRGASILLALVVVLCSAQEALAFASYIYKDRSVEIGTYRIGFADWAPGWNGEPNRPPPWTMMYGGPMGEWQVPFTATQGLVGFCLIVFVLIALLAAFAVRWKKKQASS
jgi:hypothetical protein